MFELGLDLLDLAQTQNQGSGGPKQGLNCSTRWKLYKTKVVGKVGFSGSRGYFWARNPDLEGPGPHVLLEPWSVMAKFIKQKM